MWRMKARARFQTISSLHVRVRLIDTPVQQVVPFQIAVPGFEDFVGSVNLPETPPSDNGLLALGWRLPPLTKGSALQPEPR